MYQLSNNLFLSPSNSSATPPGYHIYLISWLNKVASNFSLDEKWSGRKWWVYQTIKFNFLPSRQKFNQHCTWFFLNSKNVWGWVSLSIQKRFMMRTNLVFLICWNKNDYMSKYVPSTKMKLWYWCGFLSPV